jgi:electron transport complex protein RnfC
MCEAYEPYLKDNMETYKLDDVYPAGWEKYTVEHVTGKTYDQLPSEAGVIVNNAGTAIAFCEMVEDNLPLIRRVTTITGESINEPKNFVVRLGTKVAELIEQSGGYVEGTDPMQTHYIAGGPMTGKAILIDDLIVNDTLGSVIVKPKPAEQAYPECLGCGKCSDVCPVYLAPTSIWQAYEAKNTDLIKKLNATKCMNCGLCSYVCPSHIEITDYVDKAKTLLRREG